jgi:tRNA threonylcarbamoyladenosine modification (KEOPS) complex Cgi121 subunit
MEARAMAETYIGARGKPVVHVDIWMRQLQREAKSRDLIAQVLDATAVCGSVHLGSAFLHANRAMETGNNLARTLLIEWVLCAAGVRQVDVAFKRVGIQPGTDTFAIMLIADGDAVATEEQIASLLDAIDLERDDPVLECTEAALRNLGVGDAELAAVPVENWPDLALERVALLELER